MSQLIAKVLVLYGNRYIKPGELLPGADPLMVEAWLEAGSAEMVEDDAESVIVEGDDAKINDNAEQPFTIEMSVSDLRAAGSELGITFPVGTTKVEMAAALNAAFAAREAEDGAQQ